MKNPYRLSCLFPYLDVALFAHVNPDSTLQELYSKGLWTTTPLEECKKKLQNAKILFLHPDGLPFWTEFFLTFVKESPLNFLLFVIADSDLTTGHEHLDPLLHMFPSTQFWVQNWFGYHERVSFLPIGVNFPSFIETEKYRPLGVSFCLHYEGYSHREEFLRFIKNSKWIHQFVFPRVDYESYCTFLSECRFSPCPMGGGYDTFRFWECLMMKTIPIVKSHVFYEALRLHYPKLPFLLMDQWETIEEWILRLTPQYYSSILEMSDFSICYEEYWVNKCKELLSAEKN